MRNSWYLSQPEKPKPLSIEDWKDVANVPRIKKIFYESYLHTYNACKEYEGDESNCPTFAQWLAAGCWGAKVTYGYKGDTLLVCDIEGVVAGIRLFRWHADKNEELEWSESDCCARCEGKKVEGSIY